MHIIDKSSHSFIQYYVHMMVTYHTFYNFWRERESGRWVWSFSAGCKVNSELYLILPELSSTISRLFFIFKSRVFLLPLGFFEARRSQCVGEKSGLEEEWSGPNAY